MARISFSPILVDARGKVGDCVFSIWKGINYIRSRVVPSNPQTAAQTLQREALADCLTLWQSIKSWAKAVWAKGASGYALSGYNLWMKTNIMKTKADVVEIGTPANEDYIMLSSPAIAAGGSGIIVCDWTDEGGGANDLVFAIHHPVDTFEYTREDDVLCSLELLTISGLTPGGDYCVSLIAYEDVADEHQEAFNLLLAAGT